MSIQLNLNRNIQFPNSNSQVSNTEPPILSALASLNQQHVDIRLAGAKLLKTAVELGDSQIEVVRNILDQGVDPDETEEGQGTVLMQTCFMDNPPIEIIRLLVERGADIYKEDKNGYSLVRLLVKNRKCNVLSILLNQTEEQITQFFKNFQAQFKVGHVNSFPKTRQMGYEGSNPTDTSGWIIEVLKTAPDSVAKQIPSSYKEKLIKGFSKYQMSVEKMCQSIGRGELVLIPVGYKHHSKFLVFYKGYMLICDRNHEKSIDAFKVDPKKFTLLVFNTILSCLKRKAELVNKYYHRILPSILSGAADHQVEKDDLCKQLEEALAAKEQQIGNCAYASVKLGVRGALGLLQIQQKGKKPPFLKIDDAERALHMSKAISTHIRLKFLNEYYQLKEEGNEFFDQAFAEKALDVALKHVEKTPEVLIKDYPLVDQAVKSRPGDDS